MKIYYNLSEKEICKFNPLSEDIGIFLNSNLNFPGTKINFKIQKFNRLYSYEKFLESHFFKYNLLKINSIDISSMCNKFLLRTFNFFNRNSLGNYLTLIDILDPICKKYSTLTFIIPYDLEIKQLIILLCNKHNVSHNIILCGKKKFKLPLSLIRFFLKVRLFMRYFYNNSVNNEFNLFLTPITKNLNIFKRVQSKLNNKYDTLYFDRKNNLFSIKSILSTIFSHKPTVYIGNSLYNINKTFTKFHNSINLDLQRLIYKGIKLEKIDFEMFDPLIKCYSYLIIDGLYIAKNLCSNYDNIYFSYNDDPLVETLCLVSSNCNLINVQYELIYPGCAYNIIPRHNNIFTYVWNKYSKDILVKYYNYDKDYIYIFGNIRFNRVKKSKSNKIRITLTSQDVFPEVTNFFLDVIKNVSNPILKFQIKLHPSEIINYNSSIPIIKGNIDNVLSKSDLVITYNSTTCLESLFNNIPVICINPYNELPSGIPFYEELLYFNDKEKLVNYFNSLSFSDLKELLKKEKKSKFIIK